MSGWAAKRFYETASVVAEEGGFAVRLDGRPVRTPGKRPLLLPTEIMANHVAEEWLAQDIRIDPRTMPWTRSANTALDKVATQRAEVADHLVEYAGTDLLCYRARGPEGLVARQRTAWDPILEWLTRRYDVRLCVTSGVMPVEQDAEALLRLARALEPMSDFQLTGFSELVTLSGSFSLGLAAAEAVQPADDIWNLSRIDEDWQAEQWGIDEDAALMSEMKRAAFLHADRFLRAA